MKTFWPLFALASSICLIAICVYHLLSRPPEKLGPVNVKRPAVGKTFDISQVGQPEVPQLTAEQIAALPTNGGDKFNRLIFESSPYLLSHATNPVDWYPWCNEAFEIAKQEDKPVFLSIGFSSCHWCNVMEYESFRDNAIAKLLNQDFVCIKVDKESLPEVDETYMKACFAVHGRGGWPLNAVLTPDGKPFFVTNYLPAHSEPGKEGLADLLPRLVKTWKNDREKVTDASDRILRAIEKQSPLQTSDEVVATLNAPVLAEALKRAEASFDRTFGGISGHQKHLNASALLALQSLSSQETAKSRDDFLRTTLDFMSSSEIYDPIHFGFHRYATKPDWSQPHFEKQSIDQALMLLAFTENYRIHQQDQDRVIALQIANFLTKNLKSDDGFFYTSVSADGNEAGDNYYLWSVSQLKSVLSESQLALARTLIAMPQEETQLFKIAIQQKIVPADGQWDEIRQKLCKARQSSMPRVDKKISAKSNSFVIAALAHAGSVLKHPEIFQTAEASANRFISTMIKDDKLFRFSDHADMEPAKSDLRPEGLLEDYVAATWCFLQLYQTTSDVKYLSTAWQLQQSTMDKFWNDQAHCFQQTRLDQPTILFENFPNYDTENPSGNSLAINNLLFFSRFFHPELESPINNIQHAFSKVVSDDPVQHMWLLANLINRSQTISFEINLDSNSIPAPLKRLRADRPLFGQLLLTTPSDRRELGKIFSRGQTTEKTAAAIRKAIGQGEWTEIKLDLSTDEISISWE